MMSVLDGDVPLHYTDTGGDGPAVLLAHGFFLDHTMFDAQAAALADRWRVIRWDARGHGATPDTDRPYTYWDHANDALTVLDHLGVEQAVVGGLSQGGFTALRIALRAPHRVRGLILCDTEATACHPDDRQAYQGLFDALGEHGATEAVTGPLAQQLLGDSPLAAQWQQRWRQRPLPLGPAARCLLERDDVSDRLGEITCPTLLIWGEHDVSLPRDRMDLLRTRLPRAGEVQVIAGAAHTPPLTHPQPVTAAFARFLQDVAPPA